MTIVELVAKLKIVPRELPRKWLPAAEIYPTIRKPGKYLRLAKRRHLGKDQWFEKNLNQRR